MASGLRSLLRKEQVERELDEELRAYQEMAVEQKIKDGMSPKGALRAVRLERGTLEVSKEIVRSGGWESFVETCWQDLRFGLRMLRKSPGFTLVAVVTLALGIGANTAVFSVVESILLRPLPFRDSDQLVAIWATQKGQAARIGASMPEFEDYKAQSHSFEYLANSLSGWTYTWTGQGEPRNVNCTAISYDFFPMLGIKPYLGRLYTPAEYHVDGVQVVISYRFWTEQLGSDPHVVGRVLNLDGTAQTVIGVMPPVPDLFPETDIWAKIVPDFQWMRIRGNKFLDVVGQLKPGVTPGQADQELTAILQRGPGESQELSVHLIPLKDELTGNVRPQLHLVMAAVSLVLLIACANVAYLLLARNRKRQAEIAVRVSLGAGRGRLMRQFITANLALATLGGATAIVLALASVRLFGRVNTLPRNASIGVDAYALLFAFFITAFTGLLLALASSTASSKLDVIATLKTERKGSGSAGQRSSLLLVSEVSLAVLLSITAGLLLRSFQQAEHLDPGFLPDHLLSTYLRTNDSRDARLFFPQLVEQTAELPGVSAAALGKCMPGVYAPSATLIFGDRPNDPMNAPTVEACWISSDFFKAIGTRLLNGRFFTVRDDASASPVVIVNQALAESYWPGQNPIGKQIGVNYVGAGRNTTSAPRLREIVGIVANVKQKGLDLPVEAAVYTPYLQDETNHAFAGFNLFVRTIGPPTSLAGTVRALVHSVRADQPIDVMQTMNDALFRALAPRRLSLVLVTSFAGLALLLSAIGIFGMIAYTVSQRTHEFGVRLALGAKPQDVLQLVLGQGFKIVTAGVFVGVGAGFAITRFMRSLLYGVGPTDPLTFTVVAVLFALVALAACYIPARRASRVDPIVALRYE